MNSGNKYHRMIHTVNGSPAGLVDVYSVLKAFNVTCPARQHAIKKLLCAGIRGKADERQDLEEARDAIERGLSLTKEHTKENTKDKAKGGRRVRCIQPKSRVGEHFDLEPDVVYEVDERKSQRDFLVLVGQKAKGGYSLDRFVVVDD
jgi:hypothetical protein